MHKNANENIISLLLPKLIKNIPRNNALKLSKGFPKGTILSITRGQKSHGKNNDSTICF